MFQFFGCGGGGGGGGAPQANDPVSFIAISNVSPAGESAVASKSPMITFNSDKPAKCRWAAQDIDYDGMLYNCSEGWATSHGCQVTSLNEGRVIVYIACESRIGQKDTAASNKHISYIIDTATPGIAIDYPQNGTQFDSTHLPERVSISYSDVTSGVDTSTLHVFFKINGRSIEITDLFGKDRTQNAFGSTTDPSNTDPINRTSVSQFPEMPFVAPSKVFSVNRSGDLKLRTLKVDGSRFLLWDTSSSAAKLINLTNNTELQFSFPAPPLSVAASADNGKLFVVFSGNDNLYIYSLSSPSNYTPITLSGFPKELTLEDISEKLYIIYSQIQMIDVLNCLNNNFGNPIHVNHYPVMVSGVPGAENDIVTVAVETGSVRLFRTNSSGTQINVMIGLQLPKKLIVDASGQYAFLSLFSDNKVIAVKLATGEKTEIAVGSAPDALIAGSSGNLLCVNSGDSSISHINTISKSVISTTLLSTMISDGIYLNDFSSYIIAEDVWQINAATIVEISATIQDLAGNIGLASNNIIINTNFTP